MNHNFDHARKAERVFRTCYLAEFFPYLLRSALNEAHKRACEENVDELKTDFESARVERIMQEEVGKVWKSVKG